MLEKRHLTARLFFSCLRRDFGVHVFRKYFRRDALALRRSGIRATARPMLFLAMLLRKKFPSPSRPNAPWNSYLRCRALPLRSLEPQQVQSFRAIAREWLRWRSEERRVGKEWGLGRGGVRWR